jgi:hypothetical protein
MKIGDHLRRDNLKQLEQLRPNDKGHHEHEFILFSLGFFFLCEFRGAENKKLYAKETLGLVFHTLSV